MLAHGQPNGYTAQAMQSPSLAELLGLRNVNDCVVHSLPAGRTNGCSVVGDLRGFFTDNRMFAPDGEGTDEEDEDDDDGDDTGDTGEAGADDKTGDKPEVKDPKTKALSEEAKRHRLAAKAEKKRADDAERALREITEKDKPEVDRLKAENEDLNKKVGKLTERLQSSAVQGQFGLKHAAKFKDAEDALDILLRRNEFEIDEDTGEVDGLDDAVEELLKKKPYLAASGGKDDEDDKDSSTPSGRTTNGHKKGKKQTDDEVLARKFPALRR